MKLLVIPHSVYKIAREMCSYIHVEMYIIRHGDIIKGYTSATGGTW